MSADLLKTSIVMVPDVSVGLTQLLGDFFKRMALEEMQSKRLSLIFGQRFQNPSPAISSEEPFDSLFIICACIAARVRFNWFVCDSGQVKALRLQLPSAQECLGVRDTHDPGTSRTFRAIEQRALPMDIKEDFLDKIVRLSPIAEDPATDAPDAASVAAKK